MMMLMINLESPEVFDVSPVAENTVADVAIFRFSR